MSLRLFDTHSHLPLLEHDQVDSILERARKEGVWKQVTVSTDPTNWNSNRDFGQKHDDLYYSIGVHPHEAKHWDAWEDEFHSHFPKDEIQPRCVAIGEMGMDFFYNHSEKEQQLVVFEKQLLFAKKVNLPIIIHCRDAFEEIFESLEKHGLPEKRGVFHCFTGDKAIAERGISLGLRISFSGIVTFKNAKAIQEAAKEIPLESILIETDCPFLAPVPQRGKPNEPSYLKHTAQFIADLRGIALEKFAEQSTQNALEFFHIS